MYQEEQKMDKKKKLLEKIWRYRGVYLLLLPSAILLFIFWALPLGGIVMAFQDFVPARGFFESKWVGLKHFKRFFDSPMSWPVIRNTVTISLYRILAGFPLPIVLALICNQMRVKRYKKVFQVITYLPHFISTVVLCGMVILFLSPGSGVIGVVLKKFGIQMPNLMASASAFPHIYVWSGIWQNVGWNSILYVAALAAIDPSLYEVATMDGATKFQKMLYIDLPLLMPTAVIMLIMEFGSVMSVGFEKVYLLQNTMNTSTSQIIATYAYELGLVNAQYSLSTAIGLFQSVVNLILVVAVNMITKKMSDTSLF